MFHAGDSKKLDVYVERKRFRTASGETHDVMRDLSLTLHAAEIVALVGPSGCGKTTLLRIIAGLERDFVGTLNLPMQSRIGMVFQEPRLLPWRTVQQNLRLTAPDASDADLSALCDMLGLSIYRDRFPGELSLGLARRVAIARAFAVKPDLLLLDEPFVSLDATLAARLRDELGEIIEHRKVTTLLVTHDLDEAIRLADRILLLSPRPMHMIAEIVIDHPRKAMNAAEAAKFKAELCSLIAQNAS